MTEQITEYVSRPMNPLEWELETSRIKEQLPEKHFHIPAEWNKIQTQRAVARRSIQDGITELAKAVNRGKVDTNSLHPRLRKEIINIV